MMKIEKNVSDVLTEISEIICTDVCKHREKVYSEIKDPAEAEDVLLDKHCCDCIVLRLS